MSKLDKQTPDTAENKPTNQAWGGRFNEPVDDFVARFTASVNFDQRLAQQDIQGSIAHAKMLKQAGVLNGEELESICNGLQEIKADIENGKLNMRSPLARALIGKEEGDSIEVHTPGGTRSYEVISIKFI